MKQIPIGKGMFAIVDDEDFERLSTIKWHYSGRPPHIYAVHSKYIGGGRSSPKFKRVSMHRLLMNFPDCLVDHKNRNTLDNRKENLRLATHTTSSQNRKVRSNSKTGYKGVHWRGGRGKYRVVIRLNGKPKVIGHFVDVIEAARAYDAAAKERFGAFAWLNFPES